MAVQVNRNSSFYVATESDIAGADSQKNGSSAERASTQPNLGVGYYNAVPPTLLDGDPGALQLDSRSRLLTSVAVSEETIAFNLPASGPDSGPVEVIRVQQTRFMALRFPSTMQAGTTLKVEVRPLNSAEDWAVVHDGGSKLALPAEPNTALSAGDMAPLACWINHEWRITPSANPSANTVLVLRIS